MSGRLVMCLGKRSFWAWWWAGRRGTARSRPGRGGQGPGATVERGGVCLGAGGPPDGGSLVAPRPRWPWVARPRQAAVLALGGRRAGGHSGRSPCGREQGARKQAARREGLLAAVWPRGWLDMWGGDRAARNWGTHVLAGGRAEQRNRGAVGTVAAGGGGWGSRALGGGLLRGQGAGEGSQVQSGLRLPRRPALTAVALGPVPVSGLKSAPPAQACPGTWPRGAGINTGKLEGLPELTRSLQLQGQG